MHEEFIFPAMKRQRSNGHRSPACSADTAAAKPTARSRIGNGSALLPTVDGRSIWARLMRDSYTGLLAHLGGADHVSETQRMAARRVAALEAELVHLEDAFARARAEGGEPDMASLDLYSRLSNTQRRLNEVLGWQRQARDVTPNRDVTGQIIDAIRAGIA